MRQFIRFHTAPSEITQDFIQLFSHMQQFSPRAINRLSCIKLLSLPFKKCAFYIFIYHFCCSAPAFRSSAYILHISHFIIDLNVFNVNIRKNQTQRCHHLLVFMLNPSHHGPSHVAQLVCILGLNLSYLSKTNINAQHIFLILPKYFQNVCLSGPDH